MPENMKGQWPPGSAIAEWVCFPEDGPVEIMGHKRRAKGYTRTVFARFVDGNQGWWLDKPKNFRPLTPLARELLRLAAEALP